MNSAGGASSPSSGGGLAAASDGFEEAELPESAALADTQQQEQIEATTRMERQRGSFTAGFPLEPTKPDATKSTSRRAGYVNHPRNRLVTIIEFVLSGPLFPMPVKITHFSGLSKQIRRFLEKVSYGVGIAHFPTFSSGYTINRQLTCNCNQIRLSFPPVRREQSHPRAAPVRAPWRPACKSTAPQIA